jgi:hypothetical protein
VHILPTFAPLHLSLLLTFTQGDQKLTQPNLKDRPSSIASTTSSSSSGSWLILTSECNNFSPSPSSAQPEIAYIAKNSKVFKPVSNIDAERNLFLRRARDN